MAGDSLAKREGCEEVRRTDTGSRGRGLWVRWNHEAVSGRGELDPSWVSTTF